MSYGVMQMMLNFNENPTHWLKDCFWLPKLIKKPNNCSMVYRSLYIFLLHLIENLIIIIGSIPKANNTLYANKCMPFLENWFNSAKTLTILIIYAFISSDRKYNIIIAEICEISSWVADKLIFVISDAVHIGRHTKCCQISNLFLNNTLFYFFLFQNCELD